MADTAATASSLTAGDATNSTPTDTSEPAVYDPLADPDRTCFICLQSPAESPDAAWVAPCPCTLTAHTACLMAYVASTENTRQPSPGRPGKGVCCPACQAPLTVTAPRPDRVVHFFDAATATYRRRLAPHLLGATALTMALAGSSYYGFTSFLTVAGPDTVAAWLRGAGLDRPAPSSANAFVRSKVQMVVLGVVAPGLLLHRALPAVSYSLVAPVSWAWCAVLALERARRFPGTKLALWPPSGEACLAALPTVGLVYCGLYAAVLGPLERRLDRALKGRLVDDNEADGNARAGDDFAAAQDDNAQARQRWQAPEERHQARPRRRGFLGALRHFIGADEHDHDHLDEPDEGFEANIVIDVNVDRLMGVFGGGGGDDDMPGLVELPEAHLDEFGQLVDLDLDLEPALFHHEPGLPAAPDVQVEGGRLADRHLAEPVGVGAAPAPAVPLQAAQLPDRADRLDRPDRPDRQDRLDRQERGALGLIGDIFGDSIAAAASQLLLPSIAAGAGDILRVLLPARLTTRTFFTKPLLSERWVRSLVGGALFVVTRDLLALYIKWRRVQARASRTVANYEGRRTRR